MAVTRTMEIQFLSISNARNNSLPRCNVGSYMVVPQEVRNALLVTNKALGMRM